MESRRIAYLASEYPAVSHTFIFREVQCLRAQGFTVLTASIRRPEYLEVMTAAEKAEADATRYIKTTNIIIVLWIHAMLKLTSLFRYLRMFFFAWRLARKTPLSRSKAFAYFMEAGVLVRWMRKNRVDHVHVHFANPAATVALIASAFTGISYSLSMHGPDEFYNIETDLIRLKVGRARFVRCISHYCRSQVLRVLPVAQWKRCHVVRLGVDLEKFALRVEPKNEVPELLCVGRLTPAKGQHILLQACGLLHDHGVTFKLTLVGGGQDMDSLKALAAEMDISDLVTFTGPVGQEAIHAYFDKADVFALASFAEGLPVVLMEAMAKGIPCVTTTITGVPELIEHLTTGLLAPAGDMQTFAKCLEMLVSDRQFRAWMGKKGRDKVEADFDLQKNCGDLVKLFEVELGKRED